LGEYQFTTYREAHARIENIGRGLLTIGVNPGDRILIFAETRPEWLLSAFAAFRHSLTVVTLYATLGEEAVKHGINESQVSIILTSSDLLSKLEVEEREKKRKTKQLNFVFIENLRFDIEYSSCRLFSAGIKIANS